MSTAALLEPSHRTPLVARDLGEEVGALARLAAPVAISQVGQLTMGLVDLWMVGGLGAAALGGVSLADGIFFTLAVLALGTIQAVEPQVSQAHGAGDPARGRAAWRTGRSLALVLAVPMLLFALVAHQLLSRIGLTPEVEQTTRLYLESRSLGVVFMLLFAADRAFLHGLGLTRPAMLAMLLANVLNLWLDWGLIYGRMGLPMLGAAGAGWATTGCTLLSWLVVRSFAVRVEGAAGAVALAPGSLRRTLRLGIPIGLSHASEVGAFALAGLFMSWLGTIPLAAHQVAIKMASTSFMLAVAIGTATAIRVGNAIGAGRPGDAARSGRVGLVMGVIVMGAAGLGFVFGGRTIAGAFVPDDPAVIELGAALLVVAAAFQISDGSQAILAGALRGAGDTAFPFWANLAAYYLVALPLAWTLVFMLGAGPVAVWWALAVGLTGSAGLLLVRFTRVVHRARPIE